MSPRDILPEEGQSGFGFVGSRFPIFGQVICDLRCYLINHDLSSKETENLDFFTTAFSVSSEISFSPSSLGPIAL
jgi:hypothetical protein